MDGMAPDLFLTLDEAAAGRLMPMHLWITPTGHIRSAGPTLLKVCPRDSLIGQRFLEVFTLRRPRAVLSTEDLLRRAGTRLSLALRKPPHTGLRGTAVPLAAGQGLLMNLSFGISVAEAVRDHDLTDADFAATDLTVEMLYLVEAKTAVMEELRRLNQRLQGAKKIAEEQALTDAVTGLRNRRAMERTLRRLIEMAMPFSLMNIDLDYFKQVNDTLGHAAGDFVLQEVARVLSSETRGSDTVARVGGDEFVLIFPGLVSDEKLQALALRILARLEEPMLFEGNPCRISGSFGTVMSTIYAVIEADQILADADRALYHSKRQGRGRVTAFAPGLEADPGA